MEDHTTTGTPCCRFSLGSAALLVLLVAAVAVGGFAFARQSSPQSSDPARPAAGKQDGGSPSSGQSGSKPSADQSKEKTADGDDKKDKPPENPFPNGLKAPAGLLEGGTDWLNASGAITLRDLKGKVVLFDFWTYCCINCMHVLPDLKYLEKKYPKELVVIGVHSAKFDNEKDSENIRRAIQRYEIEHPVVNDSKMIIWRKFGTRAWPTVALIDPEGNYCGSISGEGHRELLDEIIGKVVKYHRSKGTLDETPVRFDLESAKLKPTPLRFPGKVLADAAGNRLFVADSNHNRIVISTLDGSLTEVVGTGAIGAADGAYDKASFNHPQGMSLVGNTLYVADTENHLIRTIDLEKKTVATLAGTGKKPKFRGAGGKLRETAFASPWALEHVDGQLFIAMAGPHQIWRHKLGTDQIAVYAGSGREDITDGKLDQAALAQPSGMVSDGKFLYVCDSEGSAIRKIAVDPAGEVTTLVGASDLPLGRSLFEFGDTDGAGDKARLQHPLGIAIHNRTLYIADTYNHKIKKVALKDDVGEATAWLGDGKRGDRLEPPRFAEPAGLSLAAGKLYIADTNNHRICVADLESGKVSVVTIAGLKPPVPPEPVEVAATNPKDVIKVAAQTVGQVEALEFKIPLTLPEDFKLNKLFPLSFKVQADDGQELIADTQLKGRHKATADGNTVAVRIPLAKRVGSASLQLAVTFGYCREGTGGLCKVKTVRWSVPVTVSADSKQSSIQLDAGKIK